MRANRFLVFAAVCILWIVSSVDAAHYITGQVNNALDGTSANGKTVMLWQLANGKSDNVTDIVGLGGNSGTDNVYLIDCEMLDDPCDVEDIVAVQVINMGDDYVSANASFAVTGSGFDVAPQLNLNSLPNITLSPANNSNKSMPVTFTCSAYDPDGNLKNISLYGNWSGWHLNETKSISGSSNSSNFVKNLSEGIYQWACMAYDDLDISRASDNFTLRVDLTKPAINSVSANVTEGCLNNAVRVSCNASDSSLQSVIIRAWNSTTEKNYTALFLSGIYYSDITLNGKGLWEFGCWANDSAGNYANLSNSSTNIFGFDSDITIKGITFSNNAPGEDTSVGVNASLRNDGCGNTGNFTVGFYRGDPDLGGQQINGNVSVSLSALESKIVNVWWNAAVGNSTIFAYADINNSIAEINESNNKNSSQINVPAWMHIYGNTSVNKILTNEAFANLSYWGSESLISGSIFVADVDNDISWDLLQAIGINGSGAQVEDDFSEIDNLLGMSGFNDSVENLFSDGGVPRLTMNFNVYQKEIQNVSAINSTNNSNFYTGILWDMDDDTNGEYDSIDREDLIFVANVNKNKQGAYGDYDYEIRIPARLRDYNGPDTHELYLYYELN